jgi:hypothetical protein
MAGIYKTLTSAFRMAAFTAVVHATLAGGRAVVAAIITRRWPRTLASGMLTLIFRLNLFHELSSNFNANVDRAAVHIYPGPRRAESVLSRASSSFASDLRPFPLLDPLQMLLLQHGRSHRQAVYS